MNDDEDYNLDQYKGLIDQDRLIKLWSKLEVAKILIKQANKLSRTVRDDIEFYSMVKDMKDK